MLFYCLVVNMKLDGYSLYTTITEIDQIINLLVMGKCIVYWLGHWSFNPRAQVGMCVESFVRVIKTKQIQASFSLIETLRITPIFAAIAILLRELIGWFYSLVVRTLDSESNSSSSNLDRTFCIVKNKKLTYNHTLLYTSIKDMKSILNIQRTLNTRSQCWCYSRLVEKKSHMVLQCSGF